MRNYVSLWDSNYCAQGLALYESLQRHSSEPFDLWVLPMDAQCRQTLLSLALPDLIIVIEDRFVNEMGMNSCRDDRTHQEYCWTCASNLCEYLMRCGLSEITYVDADCWFMDNPQVAFDEIGHRSIGIIPHRFTDNADRPRLEKAGTFNVSLVHFKSTPAGRACLSKWAAQVRERCSAETVGDQLYLNSWESDYGNECAVIQNIGVGVAPWNLQQYAITEGPNVDGIPVCMYHFHEYRHGERLTNYELRESDRQLIYAPYIAAVESAKERIESIHLQTV